MYVCYDILANCGTELLANASATSSPFNQSVVTFDLNPHFKLHDVRQPDCIDRYVHFRKRYKMLHKMRTESYSLTQPIAITTYAEKYVRLPLLTTALALSALALAGCGGGGSDSENQPPSTASPENPPVKILGLVAGKGMASGDQHSTIALDGGRIHTWGNNQHGQRGTGIFQLSDFTTPPGVAFISSATLTELAGGAANTLALDSTGAVWSWGLNEHGQLGVDSLIYEFNAPQRISALTGKVMRIAAGDANGLALDDRGALFAWGWNGWGQIGDGTKAASIGRIGDKLKPTPVKLDALGGASIVDIAQGWATSALLDNAGRIWTWGHNGHGQIGNGTGGLGQYELLPKLVDTSPLGEAYPVDIEFGRYSGLALDNTGRLWSWGWNNVGQLGTGKTADALLPEQVQIPTSIVKFAAGTQHALALDSQGALWAWGQNDHYQLGDGTRFDRRTPVRVDLSALGTSKVAAISAGDDFSIAMDDAGRVWGWGNNLRAQVGNVSAVYFKTPVFVLQK